jgi:hypothetical protein
MPHFGQKLKGLWMNHNSNIATVLHGRMIKISCVTTVDLVDMVL